MMDLTMLEQQANYWESSKYHTPVMLKECLDGLNINPKGHYVDVTFGGGGHSRAILYNLDSDGLLYAFDQDNDAYNNRIEDSRFIFVQDNFSSLKENMRLYREFSIDGIIADLGVSSHQLDVPFRGFSTRFDAELDLRMNSNQHLSAKDVVNDYSEEKLREIFKLYGELPNASRIAYCIVRARSLSPIYTTFSLKNILSSIAPKGIENKFYAMVFQALRIEVNNELEVLKMMLVQAGEILKSGGRLVVMSYHSLEDRLVKNFIKSGNFEGKLEKDFFGNNLSPFELITKKPITATQEELLINPRSRSAKLRIAQKK